MLMVMARKAPKRTCVYGPVPSRRLGFSLGVDILPFKTCTLDCVYCQLGSSSRTTVRRKAFFNPKEVLAQVQRAIASGAHIDHITFSGSGEPTLNRSIGGIIRGIKKMTDIPVAVLTNATLLSRTDVREALRAADVVVPSLDAATPGMFRRINRPHRSLSLSRTLKGLAEFRRRYKGRIWLEIMLVKGINDSPSHVRKLKEAIAAIRPDKVQLNTVVRPPAVKNSGPLCPAEMEKIREAIGEGCEVVADFPKKAQTPAINSLEAGILSMVRRRPVTAEDIAAFLGRDRAQVRKVLASLVSAKKIRRALFKGKTFFSRSG
jgi:wyosine [tRNA(Phe)-imidazoG37] synthetase (radical SAM superfamily)